MDTIIWTPEMSVGVKEIDDQHRQFIQIIADFYVAFDKNKLQLELEDILQKLIDYAIFHFATEEGYFDEFDYAFKDEHKQKHKELREKLSFFKKRFEKEGSDMVVEFMGFLTDWLVDHLETEDQKYVKCFHDHGLS